MPTRKDDELDNILQRATCCVEDNLKTIKTHSQFVSRHPAATCSEHDLQTELQLPRVKSCGRLAKLRAAHVTNRVVEIHTIEKIKCIRTELDLDPVRNRSGLDERQIDVLERRPTKRIPAEIAVRARSQTWRRRVQVD